MKMSHVRSSFMTMLFTSATVLFGVDKAAAQHGVGQRSTRATTPTSQHDRPQHNHQQQGDNIQDDRLGFNMPDFADGEMFGIGFAENWESVWKGHNGVIRNGADKMRYKRYMKDNLFLTRDKHVLHPGANSDFALYEVTLNGATGEFAFHYRAGHIGAQTKPTDRYRPRRHGEILRPVDYYNRGQFTAYYSAKYLDTNLDYDIDTRHDPMTAEILTLHVPYAIKDEGRVVNRIVTIEVDHVNAPDVAIISHHMFDRNGDPVEADGFVNGMAQLQFDSPEELQKTMRSITARASEVGFNNAAKVANVVAERVAELRLSPDYNHGDLPRYMFDSGYMPERDQRTPTPKDRLGF